MDGPHSVFPHLQPIGNRIARGTEGDSRAEMAAWPPGKRTRASRSYNLLMPPALSLLHPAAFACGLLLVLLTLYSALSTFVLPRSARSFITRVVFIRLRAVFDFTLRFAKSYRRRDAIMAYYAPVGLMMLLPAWYVLIALGYTAIYWGLGAGDWTTAFELSGSSLFTLGVVQPQGLVPSTWAFSESMLGLLLVAILIAYLPAMYAAFSRREQAVNLLEVRAGTPPSAVEMLMRFHRIHGLDKLGEYWRNWEAWFADIEESHTTLAALVFFRSPRPEISWITAAGAVLDGAALALTAVNVPYEPSAALCIRAGFLALRRIANYFQIPNPQDPHFPADPISISREEFDAALVRLEAAGLPLRPDREQAWRDFGGWRVNYDLALVRLCVLTMAPASPWSSDRIPALCGGA